MTASVEPLQSLPITVYTLGLDGRVTGIHGSGVPLGAAGIPGTTTAGGSANASGDDQPIGRSVFELLAGRTPRERISSAMERLRTGRAPIVSWEIPEASNAGTSSPALLIQMAALHGDGRAVDGFAFCASDISSTSRAHGALIDAGIAISASLDEERICREAARRTENLLRTDGIAIAMAEHGGSPPSLIHHSGYSETAPEDIERRLAPAWREAVESAVAVSHPAADGVEITVPLAGTEQAADLRLVTGAITVLVRTSDADGSEPDAEHVVRVIAAQTAAAMSRARQSRRREDERRLRATGDVAAGIAHELRTSLLGVSSAIQLVRFRAREDPVMEKNIGRIMREVERLNRMSTSLQELGGREAVQLAPGDPDAAWETVLEEHQGRLEARSLALRRSRAATSARCAVNEERLARAFSQVLLNAIENAPEASDLTLESETLPDGGWQCRLVNGGPVVPADTLSRAFEIFFSTRSDGSGIGLALCRRIMDEHHGTIDLTSSEPAGTTATFWLPPAE